MRAALFAIAALAAVAHAQLELGMCNVTQLTLPEPCELALSTKQGQTSEQLARAVVWSLWFSYDFAVDAFATSTDGTIVVVTNTSTVENVFAQSSVQAQLLTFGDSVPEKGRLLFQPRNLPACDAPTPAVTRAFPLTACALNSSEPAPKGCGIVVKSTLPEHLSSQTLAAGLVGILRFVFGKAASVLNTTADGQVVLVLEEEVSAAHLAVVTTTPHVSVGATALPPGEGQVLSGPQTCTELRDVTLEEPKSESDPSANTTEPTSESKEAAAGAAQASSALSAHRAAAAAVWVLGVAAFAQ